jgi:hypothetical protein
MVRMVEMHVEGDQLVCEIEGMHKFWACKSLLKIPPEHIESVQARPEDAQNWWHGWKMIGTDVPGVFAAGLFRVGGKWVFWDVRRPEHSVQINLRDETYSELLLEVENPDDAVSMIQSAIGK